MSLKRFSLLLVIVNVAFSAVLQPHEARIPISMPAFYLSEAGSSDRHGDRLLRSREASNRIGGVPVRPLAADDSGSTNEDTSVVIDVLGNDSDSDGYIDPTTVTIDRAPYHGATSVDPNTGAVTYTPTADFHGVDTFKYTVNDNDGETSNSAIVTVTVTGVNDAPVITTAAPNNAKVGHLYSYTVGTSDVDGDAVTVSLQSGPSWLSVTNNSGTYTLSGTPAVGDDGEDQSVELIASDGSLTDTESYSLDVDPNVAPVAGDDSATTSEDTAVTISVLSNDSDGDGDALTVSEVSNPPNGSATISADGTQVIYTPDADFHGGDSFIYEVTDGISVSTPAAVAAVSVTVNPVNDAPVGYDITRTINEDTDLVVPMTDLASDVDGDNLTFEITAGGGYIDTKSTPDWSDDELLYSPPPNLDTGDFIAIQASDPSTATADGFLTIDITPVNDAPYYVTSASLPNARVGVAYSATVEANDVDHAGSSLGFTVESKPTWLTVTDNGDGTVTLGGTPAIGDVGSNYLDLTVSDPSGGMTNQIFTIEVDPNASPVADDDNATTNEDTAVTIDVLVNDSDAEGDQLWISVLTNPAKGSAVVNDGGTAGFPDDDRILYTPDANYFSPLNTPDTFTYQVSDGTTTASATVEVTVTSINDAPVAHQVTTTVAEDTELAIAATNLASDVDGDNLTLMLVSGDPAYIETHGNADWTDDQVLYFPPLNDTTGAVIYFQVEDPSGLIATNQVNIDITSVEDAPVADDDSATTNEDTAVTIDVLANDSDGDGDALTVSEVSNPPNGSATISADGKQVIYTPDANFHEGDSFIYEVTDGISVSTPAAVATVSVTVTSVNDAPVANDISKTVEENTDLVVPVTDLASDVDGDNLTFTITAGSGYFDTKGTPEWSDDELVYSPPPNDTSGAFIAFQVNDPSNATADGSVTIDIVPDPFAAKADYAITTVNTPITMDVLANDQFTGAISITNVTTPAWGQAAIDDNGTPTNGSDDLITYTPADDDFGVYTFEYTISDGSESSTATVTVTVNAVPSFTTDASLPTATVGVAYSATLAAADDDHTGNDLAFAITPATQPDWLTFTDNGDGTATLEGTPAVGDVATVQPDVTVTDQAGASAQRIFSLPVVLPTIQIDEPFGYRVWVRGGTHTIGYSYPLSRDVDIHLIREGGGEEAVIATNAPGGLGQSMAWDIPLSVPLGNYHIRVSDSQTSAHYTESDLFAITMQSVLGLWVPSVKDTEATLDWTTASNTTYNVEVSTDAAFITIVQSIADAVPSLPLQNLTPNTRYWVRAQAVQGADTESWNEATFQTLLGKPTGLALNAAQSSLIWEAVPGATGYHVQIFEDAAMQVFVREDPYVTDTEAPLPTGEDALAINTTYYWQVWAKALSSSTGAILNISEPTPSSFSITPSLPLLTGLVPVDGATAVDAHARLCWANPETAYVTHYEVSIEELPNEQRIHARAEGDETCMKTTHPFSPGEQYNWKVRALHDTNGNGTIDGNDAGSDIGPWTTLHLFQASAITIVTPNAGTTWLPARQVEVQWIQSVDTSVDLTLYASDGITHVQDITDDRAVPYNTEDQRFEGTYAWNIPETLPAGTYRMQIKATGAATPEALSPAFTVLAISNPAAFALTLPDGIEPEADPWNLGSVALGYQQEQAILVENIGVYSAAGDPLEVEVQLTGHTDDFRVEYRDVPVSALTTDEAHSLGSQAQLPLRVIFSPSSETEPDLRQAQLTIRHNDPDLNEPLRSPVTLALQGTRLADTSDEQLVFEPRLASHDFGTVAQGYTRAYSFSLKSESSTSTTVNFGLTGDVTSEWSLWVDGAQVPSTHTLTLTDQNRHEATVRLAAQTLGPQQATLTVTTSDASFPALAPITFMAEVAPVTDASRTLVLSEVDHQIRFAPQLLGHSGEETLTITNLITGGSPATLHVTPRLLNYDDFAVYVGTGANAPALNLFNPETYSITPGGSLTLRVVFKPQTKGERIGFIEIGHDDGDQVNPVRVALWGVGATGTPTRYMYYTDHLGSVRATVDSTGEVVHYDDYSPFGMRLDGRSLYKGQPPKERYTGHELDEETDLYYAGARYLDPVIGRWLAVDPLADDFAGWSPYNYVMGNPLLLSDPTGMAPDSLGVASRRIGPQGSILNALPGEHMYIVHYPENCEGEDCGPITIAEFFNQDGKLTKMDPLDPELQPTDAADTERMTGYKTLELPDGMSAEEAIAKISAFMANYGNDIDYPLGGILCTTSNCSNSNGAISTVLSTALGIDPVQPVSTREILSTTGRMIRPPVSVPLYRRLLTGYHR